MLFDGAISSYDDEMRSGGYAGARQSAWQARDTLDDQITWEQCWPIAKAIVQQLWIVGRDGDCVTMFDGPVLPNPFPSFQEPAFALVSIPDNNLIKVGRKSGFLSSPVRIDFAQCRTGEYARTLLNKPSLGLN